MIITKESGVTYPQLNQEVIDFHDNNGLTIAVVDRDLTYSDSDFVDDITDDEVNAGVEEIRSFLYSKESDPIFFQYQRGESEESDWTDAIADIKERYPKIEG